VVADCFYGDNSGFTEALGAAKVRFVLASASQGHLDAGGGGPCSGRGGR
jgi:hypothetical protein